LTTHDHPLARENGQRSRNGTSFEETYTLSLKQTQQVADYRQFLAAVQGQKPSVQASSENVLFEDARSLLDNLLSCLPVAR
jgi:hypothetical protein